MKKTLRAKSTGSITDAFSFGASVLQMSVDALLSLYGTTIAVLQEGITVGKTDGPIGMMSFMAYCDLLHGGAYAAPINQLPYYAPNGVKTPYSAGDLQNLPQQSWLDWIANKTAGESANDMMLEVYHDANVPHVFPKLLSDPVYAQLKLGYAQIMTADIFLKGTTGVSTLVEGIGKGVSNVGLGLRRSGEGNAATSEEIRQLLALLRAPKV